MPRRHCALTAFAWTVVLACPVAVTAQTTTAGFAGLATIAVGSPPPLVSRGLAEPPLDVQAATASRASFTENPRVLQSLRFAFIGVQALDVHSTHLALASGQESNAVMRPFTSSVPLSLAIKTGVTLLIYKASVAGEKRHDKKMFWLLVASDVAMGMVAVHNYRIAGAH